MIVGIHKDPYGKFCKFLQRYEAILDYNGIDYIRLETSQPNFWEQVEKLDLFIFRWRQIDDQRHMAKSIIPIVEKEMKVKCFPNMATCWHFDDKTRQYYLLRQNNFPIIECWVFWDKKQALKWLEIAKMPIVFKLSGGAGSYNVILVKSMAQATKLINRMFGKGMMSGRIPDKTALRFKELSLYKTVHRWGGNIFRIMRDEDISPDWQVHKNYVLFQKYLPKNNYDTRVTTIGNRAFAFRRFVRKNDFRASGSGKIDYDVQQIYKRCIEIAIKVSKKLQFQSMAYDFLENHNNEPEICEISYTYVDSAIYNSPGYWDSDLNWHKGHFWPQYFQLVDALNLPDLKQPDMKT